MIRVVIFRDYRELSRACAQVLIRLIRREPCTVLGLPTGSTPLGLYRELVNAHVRGEVDFSSTTAFNIDEYLDLRIGHPASFAAYMMKHLWQHINLHPERRHIPSSMPVDPVEECVRYETAIRDAGGLDFTVLGMGVNGHIGFNEPGTPWDTPTHVTTLTKATLARHPYWKARATIRPVQAITMGIGTIRSSRRVLLMVSGSEKAPKLERALTGPPTVDCPASSLQGHPHLLVMSDRHAASRLVKSLEDDSQHRHRILLTSSIEGIFSE